MTIPLYDAFEARQDRLLFARMAAAYLSCGGSLLEIGCGDGRASVFFSERGFHVTVLDIEPREFAAKNVRFIQGDAAKLPFSDACFDCVYCEASFSSIEDKTSAAEEIYRVLRNGGCLILIDYVLKQGEIFSGVPSLKGACTEPGYGALFHKFKLKEQQDETAFLVSLMLHLCRVYSMSYEELMDFLGAEQAKYGFKRFIYQK